MRVKGRKGGWERHMGEERREDRSVRGVLTLSFWHYPFSYQIYHDSCSSPHSISEIMHTLNKHRGREFHREVKRERDIQLT